MWAKIKKQSGFTIVELLIVIVIIAILASIVVVAYNGIQRKARVSTLSSTLTDVKKRLTIYQVDNSNALPATLSSINLPSQEVYLEYTRNTATSPATFCVTASLNGIAYYIDSTASPTEGTCTSHIGAAPPPPTEAWTGSDGSAWSSNWTTATSSGSNTSADILNNTGRLRVQATAAWARGVHTASSASNNQGMTVNVKVNTSGEYVTGMIFFVVSATASSNNVPSTGYGVEVGIGSGDISSTELVRYNSGRNTAYFQGAGSELTSLTEFNVRLERTGTTTRVKVWAVNNAEPSSWMWSWNDPNVIAAGKPMLSASSNSGEGLSISFDDLRVYTP